MEYSTDHEIIKQVVAGNTSAYTYLINKYKNMVFTLSYAILQNREDAEELAQDVFIKAFNALPSFKGESLFSTWLYRIVINTSLNKKKLNNIKPLITDGDLSEDIYIDVDTLIKQQERKDRVKIVQSAIRLLKEDERLCITLFYINELLIAEINELTGISISNVKILLHRGRKNLYNELRLLLKTEISKLV
ncbi:MAG: RNA polymerase sigma factor [Parafilimonas sp.]